VTKTSAYDAWQDAADRQTQANCDSLKGKLIDHVRQDRGGLYEMLEKQVSYFWGQKNKFSIDYLEASIRHEPSQCQIPENLPSY
jgi:hypothetical protein